MKMKNGLHRHNINKPMSRHGDKYSKYKTCHSMMMLLCIKQHQAPFEAQFMRMLCNTEAELKKTVAYKKRLYLYQIFRIDTFKSLHLFP